MIKPDTIKSIVSEALQERNLFLVEVVVTPANKISVYIDGMNGVTIDDCAGVSRFIESSLNRSEQDYELEVSSPGPERSLLLPVQYRKNIGREVDILKTDGVRYRGKLMDLSNNTIIVETGQLLKDEHSGKKKKLFGTVALGLNQIKKAKIVVSK